jgi:hypothetical protein
MKKLFLLNVTPFPFPAVLVVTREVACCGLAVGGVIDAKNKPYKYISNDAQKLVPPLK